MALVGFPSEEVFRCFCGWHFGCIYHVFEFSLDNITLIQRSEIGLVVLYDTGFLLLSVVVFLAGIVELGQALT